MFSAIGKSPSRLHRFFITFITKITKKDSYKVKLYINTYSICIRVCVYMCTATTEDYDLMLICALDKTAVKHRTVKSFNTPLNNQLNEPM